MSVETFPVEIQDRVIECRTEQERTMLIEAKNICCDNRISERHSHDRLHAMSKVCCDYGLSKMGDVMADLAARTAQ
jgi:hypothetical protein